MKISWKHLSELVDLRNIRIEEVATKLTLAGFEIENIKHQDATWDTVLDVGITANRPDLLGWAQIAIEISAIIRRPLRIKNQLENISITPIYKNIKPKLFSEAYLHYISNVDLKKRNSILVDSLKRLDFSSTGSILDAVNFVNLKWGQAINIYKLEKLENETIRGLTFKADYKVSHQENVLQVELNDKKLSRITESSIESSSRISNILAVNYMQEESNEKHCVNAYMELLSLVRDTVIINSRQHFFLVRSNVKNTKRYNSKYNIEFSTQDINQLLGPARVQGNKELLDVKKISEITNNLYLETELIKNNIKVTIPPMRQKDLSSKADLAEEIARIYGFNNFYDNLPRFNHDNKKAEIVTKKKKIRYILRSMGLHEIVSYSLQEKKHESDKLNIVNPLNKEYKNLRADIISGIMEARRYNINQGNKVIEAFEIGNVFNKNEQLKRYEESTHLSLLLNNNNFNKSSWQTSGTPLTWAQAKGHAEELFERLHAEISWSTSAQDNLFVKSLKEKIHPTKRIYIEYNDQVIGVFSKIHDLGHTTNSGIYFAEIRLDKLIKSIGATSHLTYLYNHYSNYPKISRDLSIKTSKRLEMAKINKAIRYVQQLKNDRIESIALLSEYFNNQHEKTICLRVNYRSKKKTLTGQEIEVLENTLKAQLRHVLE